MANKAKERGGNVKAQNQTNSAEETVPATFNCERDLLQKIDARAKFLDLNRGQYLRRLAKADLQRVV